MNTFRQVWRTTRRGWQAGELRLLVLALAVAVGALAAVGLATDRVDRAVSRKAAEAIAADLTVDAGHKLPPAFEAIARGAGLNSAHEVNFPSMAASDKGGLLADVHALSDGYPLRGSIKTSAEPYGAAENVQTVPPPGHAWLAPRLFAALKIAPGDRFRLGRKTLVAERALVSLPDQGLNFGNIAPALAMNLADLPATGLTGPGARLHYKLLLAGTAEQLASAKPKLQSQLGAGEELNDIHDGRPEMRRALDRADRFLGLAALVCVLLSGAAVAMTAHRLAGRETSAVAILKTLGLPRRAVLKLYLGTLSLIGSVGILAGLLLGYLVQAAAGPLAAQLLNAELPAPGWMPLIQAACMGLVLTLGFGAAPLLRLARTPPLKVLRTELDAPPLPAWIVYGAGLAATAALILWQAASLTLGLYVLGGALIGALALTGAAALLVKLLAGSRRLAGIRLRFGIAAIARRGPASIAQVLALGLGLMALLMLAVVRTDLLDTWRASLPTDAPNQFLINIQDNDRAPLQAFFRSHDIDPPRLYPMVRARLASINGTPVSKIEPDTQRGKHLLDREANLSWASELPPGNRIVSGQWWDANAAAGRASLEQDFARALGIKPGDKLSFNLAGEPVTVTVDSLRKVEWDSFQPNFFIELTPATLNDYPASYITSFYLPPARGDVMLDLIHQFPNITPIDVGAILARIRNLMDQAALAVELVFAFTLAAGLIVLLAAVQSSREVRRQEAAVLKALGAKRATIISATSIEFALLGGLAGLLAGGVAALAGALLASRVFDLGWHLNWQVLVIGPLAGAVLALAAGLVAAWRVLNAPPMSVLRRET